MTVSAPKISHADDRALDRSIPQKPSGLAGISVRNGPVDESMDVDAPATNGHKRKSRSSITKPTYKDESDSDASQPLVGVHLDGMT